MRKLTALSIESPTWIEEREKEGEEGAERGNGRGGEKEGRRKFRHGETLCCLLSEPISSALIKLKLSDKKAVLSQGNRDAAAVLFGLKFANDIHYK